MTPRFNLENSPHAVLTERAHKSTGRSQAKEAQWPAQGYQAWDP